MSEIAVLIVGLIAVFAAAMMLISRNAVHSALFLIVTMMCIAFLFLTLNAPFLAMIQITVYAGAIMVLFLFVIMLLGSERLDADTIDAPVEQRYRWFVPLRVVLGLVFVSVVGVMLYNNPPASRQLPGELPRLRVINAAPDAGMFEVHTTDTVILSEVEFREATDFVDLPVGETRLLVHFEELDVMQEISVTLEPNSTSTLIVYGAGTEPQMTVIADDLSTVEANDSSRVAVFNAYSTPISLVDFRSEFSEDDTLVLIPELAPGEISDTFYVEQGDIDWTFVNAANQTDHLFRMNEYAIERDDSELILFIGEPTVSGALEIVQPVALPIRLEARPSFGGPRAIGYMLFSDFMLPFQLLGLLLLAAMVGAIVLTHREAERAKGRGVGRRVVSRPLVNVIAAQVGHEVVTAADTPAQLPDPSGD